MLHNAGRYAREGGPISAALQELQIQMTPLYLSALPAKAGSGKAKEGRPKQQTGQAGGQHSDMRLMPGPVARLPPERQVY